VTHVCRLEKEDYGKAEKRQKAVAFLDNPELLMMYAQSTGEVSFLFFLVFFCGCFGCCFHFGAMNMADCVSTKTDYPRCEIAFYEDALRV